MPARLARNRRAAVPFRLVLLGPLVVMMLASGGLAALASFLNERAAVRSVLEALRKDRMERVNDRLRSFLGTPLQILQLNAATLGGGVVDVSDRAALTGLFLHEARSFATVTSVYFGSAGGGLADAGREGAGTSFYLIGTDGLARGALTKREVRDDRAPGKVLARVASFDASTRPWYAAAAQSAGAVWTGPYILATGQDMTLTASRTVRSPDGRLLGVAAVDVFISQLGSFLQSADNGGGTLSFIMDRQGLLIAQSDGGTPYQPRKGRVPAQRLLASASANPLVREAFAALSAGPEGLRGIRSERLRDGRLGGLRHFMDIAPFGPPDFDWLIVTVIPASRYLDRIQAGNRETAAVLAALLCGLVAAALLAARQITRPISRLTDVAKFLARIQRAPLPVDGGWIRETRDLASAFNVMQNQVLGAIDVLDRARSDVEERNVTLQDLNQKLRALVEGAKRLVTLEAEEALGRDLLTVFSRTVGASGGSFYLAERNALRRVSALDPGHAPASIPLPLRPDCILNAVVKAGRPVVWDDLGRHHRQVGSGWTGYRNGSALVVPLIDEQQGLIGLVSLHDKQTPPFTSTDLDLASVLSSLGLEAIRTIRANAALREREEMYREVFEKTSDGLFVVEVTPELRFRLLSINPAEERMLGISGEEVAGRFHEEFLPPGLLSVARRQNLQAIQARRPMTFQSEIDLPAGRRFFHTTVAPIQDAEGRVHRIIGVARDMTESRRFEEALRRSEEKFSHAFHGNPDGAAITRMEDGVFLEVNPAFTLIFGYGRDEVIERSSLEDGLDLWVNPGDRARLVARLQEHGEVASECVRQRRKDGQIRDILLSWKVIEVEGQARILATARDITEQRRMEAALKDSEARFRLLAENAT
ncbi:MAG TPA: PAS domain S-box protein, partial [bacterium]|nr:PAS domain S-box protein [bacterium]